MLQVPYSTYYIQRSQSPGIRLSMWLTGTGSQQRGVGGGLAGRLAKRRIVFTSKGGEGTVSAGMEGASCCHVGIHGLL